MDNSDDIIDCVLKPIEYVVESVSTRVVSVLIELNDNDDNPLWKTSPLNLSSAFQSYSFHSWATF
jgi:hypothetical protein